MSTGTRARIQKVAWVLDELGEYCVRFPRSGSEHSEINASSMNAEASDESRSLGF